MKPFDIVALIENLPDFNLYRGQVGTIIEEYEPGVFEVEFVTSEGQVYAVETLQSSHLMRLHHAPLSPELITA
jgi:Domain of unknown function (DUF4926)